MWKWMVIMCLAFSATVSAETKVLAFAGSARADSINKKLVAEAAEIARQRGARVTLIDLKDYEIPFYDGDFEAKEGMPEKAKQLRKLMVQNDVILIASPEYNGSLSALLKNVIDWSSRSEEGAPSRDAFKGKKFVIMSASPGQGGGSRGLAHLRTILENVGGVVIAQQFALGDSFKAFDEQGHLKDKQKEKELKGVVETALR